MSFCHLDNGLSGNGERQGTYWKQNKIHTKKMDKGDKSTDRHFTMRSRNFCGIMSAQIPNWPTNFCFHYNCCSLQIYRILILRKAKCCLLGNSTCAKPQASHRESQSNYRVGYFLAPWPEKSFSTWNSFSSNVKENQLSSLAFFSYLSYWEV